MDWITLLYVKFKTSLLFHSGMHTEKFSKGGGGGGGEKLGPHKRMTLAHCLYMSESTVVLSM